MNIWQAVRQFQHLLRVQTWPDSPNQIVFASVHVSQVVDEAATSSLRFPLALLRILDGASDPQSPGIKTEHVEVLLAVANAGDYLGEFAMIGGQRASQGSSLGRGLLEIEEQYRTVLNLTNQSVGVRVFEVASTAADAGMVEDVGYVVRRTYTLECRLTTSRFYPAPNGGNALTLTPTVNGGTTNVAVQWAPLITRFDLHPAIATPNLPAVGSLLLVRKLGSVPTTPADGTPLAVTMTSTSYADAVATGSGTYYYALFAQYDEFGDGVTSLRLSNPATRSITV